MFSLTTLAAFFGAAALAGLATAQQYIYADFTGLTSETIFAGNLGVFDSSNAGIDDARSICDVTDACIAFACSE